MSDSLPSSLSLESLFPRGLFELLSPRRSLILLFTIDETTELRSMELATFGLVVFVRLPFLCGAIVVFLFVFFVVAKLSRQVIFFC